MKGEQKQQRILNFEQIIFVTIIKQLWEQCGNFYGNFVIFDFILLCSCIKWKPTIWQISMRRRKNSSDSYSFPRTTKMSSNSSSPSHRRLSLFLTKCCRPWDEKNEMWKHSMSLSSSRRQEWWDEAWSVI